MAIFSSLIYASSISVISYLAKPDLNPEIVVLAFISLLLFFFLGQIAGRGSMDNSLKISFSAVSRSVIGKAFTGLIIFAAILHGFSSKPAEVLASYFSEAVIRTSATALKYYFPGASVDMKAKDFFAVLAEREAGKNIPEFSSLPERIKADAVKKLAEESVKQVESGLKISINVEEPVKNQIREAISLKASSAIGTFDQFYVSSAIAIIIFITLLAASPLVSFAAVIIGAILYEALIVFRFAKRSYESRDKEIISL